MPEFEAAELLKRMGLSMRLKLMQWRDLMLRTL